ncbi:PREDICTED: lysM domain receptor-like kinase 3 [Prunus mume]|uniref:LysM domain receptor-like kinase 3 n=1 Tax=Prunus mume TaxID=102107 RepID=A0ABM0P2G9_PRUMU|nr:PREDICTED: lysM domain receptor-like kinase 3 [Prunus mume]
MWKLRWKNKKGRLAIEPASPIEARSSSSGPTEDRPHSANSHTNFSSTSSTSSASCSSLKSHIKSSLPENPLIYNKSDIHDALLSRLPGFSRRRSLCGKDVVIFQRQSGLPLSYSDSDSDSDSDLYHRLSQISKSHHTSLIKLLGASLSGPYIYLVYEYVQGANLADCLRNPNNPEFTVLSTWLSRMQVAADVADGLNYMHHSSGDNSVHNHIKSSNIIVSEQKNLQLRAKICHFATAALCCKTQSLSATVEGTRVYMAPEAQLTHKCDVYAFGVVLLELISGEEPLMDGNGGGGGGGCRRVSVIEKGREAVSSGSGVRRWVDRRLKDSFPEEVAEKMVKVALQCVKEDPDSRPDMGRVAGWVSNLFLESESWEKEMAPPIDMTISLAPR